MRSPLGSASSGSSSRRGARTKSRRGHLGVRQREALVLQLDVAEEQHVHVDRAGAVARAGEDAAQLDLDRLADVEEVERLEVGGDARGGVQEVRLVEDLADRLGLVERRDRLDRRRRGFRAARAPSRCSRRARRRSSRDRGSRSAPSIVLVLVRRLERSLDQDLDGYLFDRERKRRLGLGGPDPDPF